MNHKAHYKARLQRRVLENASTFEEAMLILEQETYSLASHLRMWERLQRHGKVGDISDIVRDTEECIDVINELIEELAGFFIPALPEVEGVSWQRQSTMRM